jgi:diguanylate cyclase (GGDEF)-like protein
VEGNRRPRLGNPLSWRIADRCFAIALLMIGATLVMLISALAGGWPFLPFPAQRLNLAAGHAIAMAWWGGLAVASQIARKRDSGGLGLAVATIILYAVTLALFTLLTGPFDSPGWIAYLGGAVVGYVMFPRWLALSGIILYAVIVIAGSLVLGAGHVPTMLAPAEAYAGLDGAAVARLSTASLALFTLTFLVIAWIVDRWRDREARYQRLASTDSLTGLTNRRKFHELATRELARSRRYDLPLALILADLDHFKRINDEFGHQIGDQALAHAARIMAGAIRDVDVIARHGGEEFAILLPMTDATGAAEVAERCARRLADTPLITDGVGPIRVTASMGVAGCAGSTCGSIDELLRAADAALYRAKEGGRDRVELAAWPMR